MGKHAPSGIKVLPFDLIGEQQELQQAVAQAVASSPGVPLSYLVHNAGEVAEGILVGDHNLPCAGVMLHLLLRNSACCSRDRQVGG